MFLKSFHGSSLFLDFFYLHFLLQCCAWQEGAFGLNTLLRSFPHATMCAARLKFNILMTSWRISRRNFLAEVQLANR